MDMPGTTASDGHIERPRKTEHRRFIVAMLVLAVIAALGGVRLRHRENADASRMIQVQGRVVSQEARCVGNGRGGGRRNSCRYFPFVVFHTRDGRRAYFRSSVGASASPFVDGQGVPVLYDSRSDDPGETAYIRDYGMRVSSFAWLVAAGFAVAALLVRILPARPRADAPDPAVDHGRRRRHASRRSR